MITSSWLGRLGRLGNQLFQYAALLGVAERRGYEVRLPPRSQHELASAISIEPPTYTSADLRRIRHRFIQVHPEGGFGYEPTLENIPDWCDVVGFFQSRRHFPPEDRLRKLLALRPEVIDQADEFWRCLPASGAPVVGLMVRRGDFVGNLWFSQLWEQGYYSRAMAQFDELDPIFVVTSDDIAWCRRTITMEKVLFTEGMAPATQLAILARCDHLIISNSTFSWWAAWYHEPTGGITIGPRRWYPESSPLSNEDQDRGEHWIEL